MEIYNFVSEVVKIECKDEQNRQCFDKLKVYTNQIVNNSLYSEIHKQVIAEVFYSAYKYLVDVHREIIQSFDFYCELLQNRLKEIDVINNDYESENTRGKSQRKNIYLRDSILKDKARMYEFIALFSHELAHIFSSGDNSIGLIRKKRKHIGKNSESGINIMLKSLQEKTLGSFHTYLNEMETDYLSLKFINKSFMNMKEIFNYEYLLKEGKLLIKYEGTTYEILSCFAPVINYIFDNELEKFYLEDKKNMAILLNSSKYRYLKRALFKFERKCKRTYKCSNGLYSKAYFDSYFKSYTYLLKIYLQKNLLSDKQKEEFMDTVQSVHILLNNKNYLSEVIQNLI